MAKPKCALCKEKSAKMLPRVQNRVGSAEEPGFCSVTCAAIYGLIALNGNEHLCSKTGEWEIEPIACAECMANDEE